MNVKYIASFFYLLGFLVIGLNVRDGFCFKKEESQRIFLHKTKLIIEKFKTRLNLYTYGLNGLKGVYVANPDLSWKQFLSYSRSRNYQEEFKGALGLGHITKVLPKDLNLFLKLHSKDRATKLTYKSLGGSSTIHYVIDEVYPVEINQKAFGLDVSTEINRMNGLLSSIDTQQISVTQPILLVQDNKKIPGILIYNPIFKENADLSTPELRNQSLLGFTYAPVLLHNIFTNALELDQKEIDFEIYYTDSTNHEILIYDQDDHMNNHSFKTQSDSLDFLNKRINFDKGKISYANISFNYNFSSREETNFKYYWYMWGQMFSIEFTIWSLLFLLVISLMKKKEDAQVLAEKMTISYKESKEAAEYATKMKGIFLATMSHEIRTPLNGVLGLAQILLGTKLEEEQKKHVETILSSGESLLGIISDALDFSKIESGKMNLEFVDFNLKHLAQEVIELYSGQALIQKINLVLEVDDTIPIFINGDSLKVRQILQNLINNAIKFTHVGGVVLIIKMIKFDDKTWTIRFEVTDTGIGIPKDKITFLFKEFTQVDVSTTRKYGGSGLGLTISKLLVDMMNGKIEVQSSLGHGTSFILEIPFKEKVSHDIKGDNLSTVNFLPKGLKVLLVEDNLVNQLVATKLLQSKNALVEIANNGVEALKLMEKGDYDIILMDCFMPVLDGYETSRKIRVSEKKKNIIIALTANSSKEDIQKCIDSGMDDFISKPFNINKMVQVINKYAA